MNLAVEHHIIFHRRAIAKCVTLRVNTFLTASESHTGEVPRTAMFRSAMRSIQKMVGFQPYQSRPSGMNSRKGPQIVGAHYFKHKDVDDPTKTSTLNQVIFKTCPACGRSKQFHLSQKNHFHMCCEGQTMRTRGTMRNAIEKPRDIKRMLRKWDFDNNRPWSNPRRPRPKGRSN